MPPDISELLKLAATRGASDVLVSAGSPAVVRIDGGLVNASNVPLSREQARALVYSALRPDQIERFETERELDFALEVPGAGRFRGNAYFQRGAVTGAYRAIPSEIPSFDSLKLPPQLKAFAKLQQGLVLFCGPTGQGKSTTQASLIREINLTRRCHIITVEDPIEYVHKNDQAVIDQREVGDDTLSFGEALRRVLRQNPDVIQVGEMRDLETISCAVSAAETGHLVFATLHTNDSAQAIARIIDAVPPAQQGNVRSQLSLALHAVVSQRLIPRADGSGRVAAVEIMLCNTAVRHLIRDDKVHQIYSVMETHAKDGMVSMDASLKELYASGVVSYDEALRRASNPSALKRL
jgi:twitching motility protein PilT